VVIGVVVGLVLSLLCLLVYDLLQSRHALLRTYPVIGRARFLLEKIGPEMRQYWFLHDKEERPFNRTQRNWVYQTAKGVQNTFGFGTEIEPDTSQNYLVIKHVPFPTRRRPRERSAGRRTSISRRPRSWASTAVAGTPSDRARRSTSRR
jgi:Glutamate synthase domain 2